MMHQIVIIILNTSLLLALSWLYFVGYRQYRNDATRQRLYAIRDELFASAAAGNVPLDSDAHQVARDTINGMIRFLHRLSLLRLILLFIFSNKEDRKLASQQYSKRLSEALAKLESDDQRKVVQDALASMNAQVVRHLILRSMLATTLILLLGLSIGLIRGGNNKLAATRERAVKKVSKFLDAEAFGAPLHA